MTSDMVTQVRYGEALWIVVACMHMHIYVDAFDSVALARVAHPKIGIYGIDSEHHLHLPLAVRICPDPF